MKNYDKKILTKKSPLSILATIIFWMILIIGGLYKNNIYVNILSMIILGLDILSFILELLIYNEYKIFKEDKYFILNCYIGIIENLFFMIIFVFMDIDYLTILVWVVNAWTINIKAKMIESYKE